MKFKCFLYLIYLFIVNLKIFVKRVLFFCSRLAARPSESKWSPGSSVSNSSLAHELWKVPLPPKALSVAAPSRPPPGLTSQKPSPASSGWDGSALRLGGWSTAESRYTPGKRSTPTLIPCCKMSRTDFGVVVFFVFKRFQDCIEKLAINFKMHGSSPVQPQLDHKTSFSILSQLMIDSMVYVLTGSSWGDSSSSGRTQWLVLKNLTPQVVVLSFC